jgi:hypothetical protein
MKSWMAWAAAVGTSAVLVSGCGSSNSNSTSTSSTPASAAAVAAGVATAKKDVAAHSKRPTSIGLTTPLTKRPPTGKTVDYIQCGIENCVILGNQIKAAAAVLGWKVNVVPTTFTPESFTAGYQKALADHPDAIIGSGAPANSIIQKYINEAVSQGIKLAMIGADVGHGSVSFGPEYFAKAGRGVAKMVIADSNGKAHVMLTYERAITADNVTLNAAKAYFAKNCPDCKVYTANLDATSTTLAADNANAVAGDSDVDYLVPALPPDGLQAALASVGRSNVKLAFNGVNETTKPLIETGSLGYAFDSYNVAWRTVDGLARQFVGDSVAPDADPATEPEWFMNKDNLPNVPDVGNFQWQPNLPAQFKKLWLVP